MEAKANILFIGHADETARRIRELGGNGEVITVHHTVSEIGLREIAKEARSTGKVVIAMDIVEYRRVCKEKLVEELAKGGFRCIAYSKACACDGHGNECRCTRSQIERYNSYMSIDLLGKVFDVVRLNGNGSGVAA